MKPIRNMELEHRYNRAVFETVMACGSACFTYVLILAFIIPAMTFLSLQVIAALVCSAALIWLCYSAYRDINHLRQIISEK